MTTHEYLSGYHVFGILYNDAGSVGVIQLRKVKEQSVEEY